MTRIVKEDFEVILRNLLPYFPKARHKSKARHKKIVIQSWQGADEWGVTEIGVEDGMYTVVEWSTSEGIIWKYSHQDREFFVDWVIHNLEEI